MGTKGIIVEIKELYNYDASVFQKYSDSMEGYEITTLDHTYLLLIDDKSSCCESFGYFSSDDDLKQFIGKELLSVEATDVALSTRVIVEADGLDAGEIQFVTFKTNDGDFQLAVYNSHNGYYGHTILFIEDGVVLIDNTL
jgi:hypothetical protein